MFSKTAINKIFLSFFIVFASITFSFSQVQATSLTLYPTNDSMVGSRTDIINNTFGSWDLLEVAYDTSNTPPWAFFAILKFDLSSIPANSTINKATFKFYLQQISKSTGQIPSYKVARAKSDWSEKTVTWSNKPEMDSSSSTTSFSNTIGYKEWDIKTLVTSWLDETYSNYGFYVASTTRADWVSTFYSKEGSQKPQLVIDYTAPVVKNIIPIPTIPAKEIPVIIDTPVVIYDFIPPTISSVKVTNTGISTAKITWETNENSTSYVEYGDTDSYTDQKGQSDSVKTHEVLLSGLVPLKTYHFIVKSADIKGNESETEDSKFLQFTNFFSIPGVGSKEIPESIANQPQDENSVQPTISESSNLNNTNSENNTGVGLEVDDVPINQLSSDTAIDEFDKTVKDTNQLDTPATSNSSTNSNSTNSTPKSIVPFFTGATPTNLMFAIIAIIILLILISIVVFLLLRKNKTVMAITKNIKPQTDNMSKKVTKGSKWVLVIIAIATVMLFVTLIAMFYFLNNSRNSNVKAPVQEQNTAWKVYTNIKHNFTVSYPSDWTYTEYPNTKDGASFYPLNTTEPDLKDAVSISAGKTLLNYVNMTLEEYAKIAGSETQNYNELVSFKRVTTSAGGVGYRTTWNVQPMTINGVPPTSKGSESLPITYFEIPNSKTYLVRASLNREEYLPIYEKMLTTIKVMAPINPTPTITDEETLKYVIKKYLTLKHGKSAETLNITVSQIDGLYAQGGASGEGGGGMWFASKEEGAWILVWDGNGTIDCSLFSLYPDFSKKLIPECYDSTKQTIIKR